METSHPVEETCFGPCHVGRPGGRFSRAPGKCVLGTVISKSGVKRPRRQPKSPWRVCVQWQKEEKTALLASPQHPGRRLESEWQGAICHDDNSYPIPDSVTHNLVLHVPVELVLLTRGLQAPAALLHGLAQGPELLPHGPRGPLHLPRALVLLGQCRRLGLDGFHLLLSHSHLSFQHLQPREEGRVSAHVCLQTQRRCQSLCRQSRFLTPGVHPRESVSSWPSLVDLKL